MRRASQWTAVRLALRLDRSRQRGGHFLNRPYQRIFEKPTIARQSWVFVWAIFVRVAREKREERKAL